MELILSFKSKEMMMNITTFPARQTVDCATRLPGNFRFPTLFKTALVVVNSVWFFTTVMSLK
jgi:hypothetical protein